MWIFTPAQPTSVAGALDGAKEKTPPEQFRAFEGAGAISKWKVEIRPEDNRHLDRDSITDVVFELTYTARRGGERAAQAARDLRGDYDSAKINRLMSIKDEYPAEWQKLRQIFEGDPGGADPPTISLNNLRDRMPYLWAASVAHDKFDLGVFVVGGDCDVSIADEAINLTDFADETRRGTRSSCPEFDDSWLLSVEGAQFPRSILFAIAPKPDNG